MDAKILRKWGLKPIESDGVPSSPTSMISIPSPATPVDLNALRAWLPPIPPFERQRLSPDTLRELKRACAVILKETTPDEAELDQTDPLEEYKKSIARAEKAEQKTHGARSDQRHQRNRKDSPQTNEFQRSQRAAQATGAGTTQYAGHDLSLQHSQTAHSLSAFPQPPKRVDSSSVGSNNTNNNNKTSNGQGTDSYRPRPHKAVSSDYIVQDSNSSSRVVTRITTAYASQTPQLERTSISSRTAPEQSRSSRQRTSGLSNEGAVYHETPKRPESSQAWVSHGRPQEEEIYALPTLHKKPSRTSIKQPSGLRSRAESIRDGIREYVKPGSRSSSRPATSHSHRPPQMAAEISRPESRGSVASTPAGKSSWWRGATGALRRKGSFTSFRSLRSGNNSSINLHDPLSPTRDSPPDLDKSLPPMPSLDTYVEPKVHISQLMVPAAPSVPVGSLASPVDTQSPIELRSPPVIPAVLDSPGQNHYFSHGTGTGSPMMGGYRHHKSPALTPASENVHRQQRPASSGVKTAMNPAPVKDQRTSTVNPTPIQASEAPRTFYSPAHQHATTDLAQFADSWREELLRKEDARQRDNEKLYQLRRQERKRIEAERRKVAVKTGKEKGQGLKNRLSKMFGGGGGGAAAHVRPLPPSQQSESRQDTIDEKRRDRTREVTVAN